MYYATNNPWSELERLEILDCLGSNTLELLSLGRTYGAAYLEACLDLPDSWLDYCRQVPAE